MEISDDDSQYVAFTLDQLMEMTEWAAGSEATFELRIVTDHVYLPEVAVLSSKGQTTRVSYLLNPLLDGRLLLMRLAAGHWYLPSVRAALAKIQYLEGLVSH